MIGKAAIFLKHRAGKLGSKVGGMFRGRDLKNKATIAKFKTDSFFKANPKKTIVAGTVGVAGLAGVLDSGDRQKMKIEAQKINKERRSGIKISRKEIRSRLSKAKQSKREFTFI